MLGPVGVVGSRLPIQIDVVFVEVPTVEDVGVPRGTVVGFGLVQLGLRHDVQIGHARVASLGGELPMGTLAADPAVRSAGRNSDRRSLVAAPVGLSADQRLRLLVLEELADVLDRDLVPEYVVLHGVDSLEVDLAVLAAVLASGLGPTHLGELLADRIVGVGSEVQSIVPHDHRLRLVQGIVNC